MSDATSPASATPNQPAGALTIQQAAQEMASRRAAAAQATTAPVAPEPAATDETDKPETAPVEVEADSIAETSEQPDADETTDAETDVEAQGDDPTGDYIELPDGTQIPVEEAVKAHQNFKALQARVTRKEQALAEERRALETERQKVTAEVSGYLERAKAEAEALAAEREKYAQKLKIVESRFTAGNDEFANVNWDELENTDPVAYAAKWAKYQRHQAALQALEAERREIEQQRSAEMERAMREARAKFQQTVAQNHSELLDPQRGPVLQQAMIRVAHEAGYSAQEIEQTLDPRVLVLWTKAAKWDLMEAERANATAKPTAPKPDATGTIKVVKARAARPMTIPAPKAALGRAQAAYNANPSRENALALMEAKRVAR